MSVQVNYTPIVQNIYEVFINFFGGNNVDLQNNPDNNDYYNIYIYWDKVKVSNEMDASIEIYGIYCRLTISKNGELIYSRPHFIRDCYNDTQWNSHYRHSHWHGAYHTDSFFSWETSPCLGTGPIIRTINNLMLSRPHYTDMDYWMLFCVELDKYVHIESLSGVPYMRLGDVGNTGSINIYDFNIVSRIYNESLRENNTVKEFIKYVLKNPEGLKFCYYDNKYNIGIPFIDTIKLFTKKFFYWYYDNGKHKKGTQSTKILISSGILKECYLKYNSIVYDTNLDSTLDANVGNSLRFNFKGNEVLLKKIDAVTVNDRTPILNIEIIGVILYKLLTILNFKYGHDTEEGADTDGAVQRLL